jgi:hypothetical protein
MRFRSRLNPGVTESVNASALGRAAVLVVALVLPLFALVGGCEDKHIGRPCELGAAVDAGSASGSTTTITSPALECPSRICILPGAQKTVDGTGPLCTAGCSSDGDCADGETDMTKGGPHCKTGFACMWPTTVGDFCCQKMCVCLDFVTEPKGGFTEPEICTKSSFGCQNVH